MLDEEGAVEMGGSVTGLGADGKDERGDGERRPAAEQELTPGRDDAAGLVDRGDAHADPPTEPVPGAQMSPGGRISAIAAWPVWRLPRHHRGRVIGVAVSIVVIAVAFAFV